MPQRFSAISGNEKEPSYLLVLFLIKGVSYGGKSSRKSRQCILQPGGLFPLPVWQRKGRLKGSSKSTGSGRKLGVLFRPETGDRGNPSTLHPQHSSQSTRSSGIADKSALRYRGKSGKSTCIWTKKSPSQPHFLHSKLPWVFSVGRMASNGELIWVLHCKEAEVPPHCTSGRPSSALTCYEALGQVLSFSEI